MVDHFSQIVLWQIEGLRVRNVRLSLEKNQLRHASITTWAIVKNESLSNVL